MFAFALDSRPMAQVRSSAWVRRMGSSFERPWARVQRCARNSAAKTAGCLVRALRNVRRTRGVRNPACRNSSRNATASFAPATHENQFALPCRRTSGRLSPTINSAPATRPPGFTTRASS